MVTAGGNHGKILSKTVDSAPFRLDRTTGGWRHFQISLAAARAHNNARLRSEKATGRR